VAGRQTIAGPELPGPTTLADVNSPTVLEENE
jgi:hypothetical protein